MKTELMSSILLFFMSLFSIFVFTYFIMTSSSLFQYCLSAIGLVVSTIMITLALILSIQWR